MSPEPTVTAFLTDSTLCIGCKACEVACKEWNDVPADGYAWSGHSYDNTGTLGHSTWRHVKFVESVASCQLPVSGQADNRLPTTGNPVWQFSSDVCKHCENAGCLEGCPTGAIVRTEFGGVFVQPDICNGCGYCVVTCPFGVVDRRPGDGRAFKCTFCYDRQKAGLKPACATACPTESILFGPIDEMQAKAAERIETLHARGAADAVLYDAAKTSVGGIHSLFILRGDPEDFNLPLNPVAPSVHLKAGWTSALATSLLLGAAAFGALAYFCMPATYRDAPLLKPPVWTWEVPAYFFIGGAAGVAAVIAAAAHFSGTDTGTLARDAKWIAAIGALLSPVLLISDLGRPLRFLYMLRVFKPQSPMSMGVWTLVAFSGAALAALLLTSGVFADLATVVAAVMGAVLATYTGVLIGATAIPVWARNVDLLPAHFGASGLGAAVSILELMGHRTPAMNALGIVAAAVETILMLVLLRRGSSAGGLMHTAELLSGPLPLGLRLVAAHIPAVRILVAALTLAGSLFTRLAWIQAGRRAV